MTRSAVPANPGRMEPWRILLVDDEEDVLASLGDLIESRSPHVQVTRAASGHEALDRLRSERFDLLITDVRMPGLNGVDVLRKARGIHPGLPAIVISAYDESEALFLSLDDSFRMRYMEKPVDPLAFLANIEKALQQPSK